MNISINKINYILLFVLGMFQTSNSLLANDTSEKHSIRNLYKIADALNIEGGRLPKLHLQRLQQWAGLANLFSCLIRKSFIFVLATGLSS